MSPFVPRPPRPEFPRRDVVTGAEATLFATLSLALIGLGILLYREGRR